MEVNHSVGLDPESLKILESAIKKLSAGYQSLDSYLEGGYDAGAIERVMTEVAVRMHDNFPYFHPLYAGQMLKPPHPVARLAYMLSLYINPNNHALDGGRASSAMEKEAVAQIAGMFGWETFLGHLTGGGTMANLEALWIAGQLHPGKVIVASAQAHYTHNRLTKVLGLPFRTAPVDRNGKMDLKALRQILSEGDVALPEILKLRKEYGFRIHADSAYGGYFTLAGNLAPGTQEVYDCLKEVDSIVIDPHKHGLQPYGCGCILFSDPSAGQFYKHDSPYTYFSSDELHLGEISLECSRPGAAAVALWATMKLMPLVRNGEFTDSLEKGREAALALYRYLQSDTRVITAFQPELDIVIWVPKAATVSGISRLSRQVFEEAGRNNLHLALADLPCQFFDLKAQGVTTDRDTITCLRSTLMKPEHLGWLEKIKEILNQSMDTIMNIK